ncbi:MAG: anti-sigma factor family protein [Terriglobales bacterium]
MNCERFRDRMLDAIQGAASHELEEHVRACGACAQEFAALKKTSALLEEWPAPEVSPYFDSRLRARMREQAAAPVGGWEWLLKPALAAAFVVLMAVGVGLLIPGAPEPVARVPVQTRPQVKAHTGSAVADLQTLDQNQELYATFDLLDEIPAQQANP